MDLIAKHNPLIDKKLKAVGNAKYTSNTLQNYILGCLSDMSMKASLISSKLLSSIQCLESWGKVMMGHQSCQGDTLELQQRLKLKTNQGFYVHCNAHCLNLVLVDSTKSVAESKTFFSLLQKLYVCVHVGLLYAPI
ncbi:hypothetical protein H4Q32_028883 [Labeo rohita]|uniref:Zinc finger MYM-type 1-like protein n=1 Tax=Labeo rohita TaxID=84645 RepID=A0ABQ8L3P9_LABRO|nr:hypothetical protein H4Q32_028883 [Labeo rohita]